MRSIQLQSHDFGSSIHQSKDMHLVHLYLLVFGASMHAKFPFHGNTRNDLIKKVSMIVLLPASL